MTALGTRAASVLALALWGVGAEAGQTRFVPLVGHGGRGAPPIALSVDAGTPVLTSLASTTIEPMVHILPTYRGAAKSSIKVIGAYRITEPAGTRLVNASASGYLPVELRFNDGRCFTLTAEYAGPTLSNAALHGVGCDERAPVAEPASPAPPADRALRKIGVSWGFAAWADDQIGVTYVTTPFAKIYQPFMAVRMPVTKIMAMNSPDAPLADMTLLTRIDEQPVLMTLEVVYDAFSN